MKRQTLLPLTLCCLLFTAVQAQDDNRAVLRRLFLRSARSIRRCGLSTVAVVCCALAVSGAAPAAPAAETSSRNS